MAEDSRHDSPYADESTPKTAPPRRFHFHEDPAAPLDLLENLLDSAPFGVLVHDAAGGILIYNRRLEHITGYPPAEIPTIQTWIEKLYPDPAYRQIVLNERHAPQPPHALRERDAVITRRDGAKRLCHFISSRDAGGIRTVFIRDVHRCSRYFENMLTAESRYQTLYRYGPLPVFAFQHSEGGLALANYNFAAAEFFGPEISSSLGEKASKILSNRADILECLEACFQRQETIRQEFGGVFPGAETNRNILATFLCVEPGFVIVHIEDLTGLRQSEERFALAFQSSACGLAITTVEDGRFIDVNPSGCEMSGYSREELIGRTVFELGIWAEPTARRRMRQLLEKHGVVRSFEYRFRRKSGEIRQGLFSASVITVREQRYILSEAQDMTERQEAEAALRRAYHELDLRVTERTLKLQEAASELDEANTALRVLLRKCDQERIELEEKVFYNAKRLILPYVEKLKHQNLSRDSRRIVAAIESKIKDLVSPVGKALGHAAIGLTPMEIRVADLIQQGSSSKEIATLLGLSTRTIESHRKNIRSKLGLANKKKNLRGFLLSLETNRPSSDLNPH